MRQVFIGLVVAAMVALVPTWAMAGNQEVAEQIAAALKNSGQLHGYRIGVKYQDGTAWLKGQVTNRDQMVAAMQLAFGVPGVTRVINNLAVASEAAVSAAPTAQSLQTAQGAMSAERTPRRIIREVSPVNRAERLGANFAPTSEPQVAMTGLQEPTLAPPDPPSESETEVAMTGLQEPTIAPPKPIASSDNGVPRASKPMPLAYTQPMPMAQANGPSGPQQPVAVPSGAAPARYDQPNMPNYAWPSYSSYPNYASLTYPKQYSPTAWPYIGPFYPYPQVPLGWRKVTLEWHDGWWALDFDDGTAKGPFSGLFRPGRRKY